MKTWSGCVDPVNGPPASSSARGPGVGAPVKLQETATLMALVVALRTRPDLRGAHKTRNMYVKVNELEEKRDKCSKG